MTTDKQVYQAIADEMAAQRIDGALWAQAIALAEGDPDRTRATYIRLRYAELKPPVQSMSAMPQAQAEGNLRQMRMELKRRLQAQRRNSLYATLGIEPDASDADIAQAIAQLDAGAMSASAEYRYARTILGDVEAREQYDRQLLDGLNGSSTARMPAHAPPQSRWDLGNVPAIVGLFSLALLAYGALDYFKAKDGNEVQQSAIEVQRDAVGVQREAVQSAADAQRQRLQAENEMRQRSMALTEEAQRRQMDYQAQQQERMRLDQERYRQQEQERVRAQQQQAENYKAQRQRQYWACINQQLDVRGVETTDAYSRCAMYR